MTTSGKKPAPPIHKNQIIDFIGGTREGVGVRNIMIGIGTKDRAGVKQAIKELEEAGEIERTRGKQYVLSGRLPRVTVIEVTGTDEYGDVVATPVNWDQDAEPPIIFINPEKRGKSRQAALGKGDRALARLQPIEDNNYNASIIKRIGFAPKTILGIYRETDEGGMLEPTDRKHHFDFIVPPENINGAKPGDLVVAEIESGRKLGRASATITEILNIERPETSKGDQPYTKIALHDHNIPYIFTDLAVEQAEKANAAPLDKRDDLRDVPLVTIDDEDARDFDDAVFAEPDNDKANPGGWHLMVAIADVAWYVRPSDELDKTALERGNSVYFPDQVVPMLPEGLSNGWCSLRPDEERPCLAVHMWIDADGRALRHQFVRGLMRSHARLTYNQVQAAVDGSPDDLTTPLLESVIQPLYGAYDALCRERLDREPLDLDLPEKKIILDDDGYVQDVQSRLRHDSHKLIEEFMIAANVAAATTLEEQKQPCLYRIHDEPPAKNLESYRQFLKSIGFKLSKGQVLMPRNFNQILKKAKEGEYFDAVSQMTLRSQSQATYTGKNVGHFGLALRRYCHFTSPIRRYADLIVHRALISGLSLGAGGLDDKPINTEEIGEHLSVTERRAAVAERDVVDRFSAAYLSGKIGETFSGKVNGVTNFGLFITLDEIASDGLLPIRSLPDDYYEFDEKRMSLKGSRNKYVFHLGMKLDVVLEDANPVSGSLVLSILGTNTSPGRQRPKPRKKSHKSRKRSRKSTRNR
ncbi:MAG: ribonuclease R [Rhodospirillaceae bacterium]|nr:ribonuclease R [Rhodospirillaceae bacterium]